MAGVGTKKNHFGAAVLFLLPNFLGVLAFVVFPVAFSILLAFTNWDLRHHNMFKDDPLRFVGVDNFIRLLTEEQFLRYLGNTLFLMLGIPFAIAGALMAAMLLSRGTRGDNRRMFLTLLAGAVFVTSIMLLVLLGLNSTAMVILLASIAGGILLVGICGSVTFYRTLFYMPHLTAGVATILIWKKLFNPQFGPVNTALQPVLDQLAGVVNAMPPVEFQIGYWLILCAVVLVYVFSFSRIRHMWNDGDWGHASAVIAVVIISSPLVAAGFRPFGAEHGAVLWLAGGIVAAGGLVRVLASGRDFDARPAEGLGSAMVFAMMVLVIECIGIGLAPVVRHLPLMAADGLQTPGWFYDYHWAKPTFIMIGLWGALGSNNMLLYLAALTNIPQDLYDAADIDGAARLQRFWHITWPQLAPTTFFIAVMSTIGGLQGGFDMARVITQGGPAGHRC